MPPYLSSRDASTCCTIPAVVLFVGQRGAYLSYLFVGGRGAYGLRLEANNKGTVATDSVRVGFHLVSVSRDLRAVGQYTYQHKKVG